MPPKDDDDSEVLERKAASMVERVGRGQVADIIRSTVGHQNHEDDDDRHYRPWKLAPENRMPSPEVSLIFKNGDSRSVSYSDQKGVWHSGDTIIVKFIEEHVLFVIIQGQNIKELATGLMKHRVEWIETIDEERSHVVEHHKDFQDKNVFEIQIAKRKWGEECEFDEHFYGTSE